MLQFISKKKKKDRDDCHLMINSQLFLERSIKSYSTYSDYKSMTPIRVYSENELKKAANDYHPDRILIEERVFTYYKGIDQDRAILIKKFKDFEKTSVEEVCNFVMQELVASSQFNHKNMIQLSGCCLEARYPILVFEFCFNTILHFQIQRKLLSWETRLRIATEVADAVTYLHTALSRPLLLRNISSRNILLDQYCVAKLSNLLYSVSIPFGKTHVQSVSYNNESRLGNLFAPEQYSGRLLEKTDVYGFGLLLIELLTGYDPCDVKGQEMIMRYVNLELDIVDDCAEIWEVLEGGMNGIMTAQKKRQLEEVAVLAVKCTRRLEEDRPMMLDVTKALHRIKMLHMPLKESSIMFSVMQKVNRFSV